MNGRDGFERRVHEALDNRCDPLDDPLVVAWLEEHPEELETFAAMMASLRSVATAVPVRSRPPRRITFLHVAAAALLLAVGVAGALLPPHGVEPKQEVARGGIVWFEMRSSIRTSLGVREVIVAGDGESVRTETNMLMNTETPYRAMSRRVSWSAR